MHQKFLDIILQETGQQKNRLFVWSPFFLALGIASYFTLKIEPNYLISSVILLIILSVVCFNATKPRESITQKTRHITVIILFLIALGFNVAQVRTLLAGTALLQKPLGPVNVIGTIERIEKQEEGKGSRITLGNLEIERLEADKTPKRVRLTLRKDAGILSGQRVQVLAKLNPPSPPVSPGAFDFQRYAFFKGLGAVGFIYNEAEVIEEASGFSHFWTKTRERLSARVDHQMQGRQGAIANALMTGQRGAISKEDIQAMRDAGLAHLLAISGMHVGMIVGVLFFFSRFAMAAIPNMALRYPIKKYAALFALLGALLYTLIVGATIPTQRALMMSGLVLIAICLDRTAISMRLVVFAAFIVLLFAPESLVSVSFQMSFAAVVALVCFYEWLRPVWTRAYSRAGIIRRASLYLIGVVLTTLVAGFATGFFALYHFQTFALYGAIANIIAVPIMAFIVMPSLLLSYLLMPIGLEGLSLDIAGWGISWILAAAHWTANMDGAVLRVPAMAFTPFLIIVICLWIACVWRGKFKTVALSVALITALFLPLTKQPDIQISSGFKLVSMRDDQSNLWMSSGRQDRYTADNWLRRNGQKKYEKKVFTSKAKKNKNDIFACDDYGCRAALYGKKVSWITSQQAIREDCEWADIILSEEPVRDKECAVQTVVDRFDVWRKGAHALWIRDSQIIIKTDQEERGNRPWNNRNIKSD